jgi:hypothetical protein
MTEPNIPIDMEEKGRGFQATMDLFSLTEVGPVITPATSVRYFREQLGHNVQSILEGYYSPVANGRRADAAMIAIRDSAEREAVEGDPITKTFLT